MALIKAALKNHYYTFYQLSFITPVPNDLAMQAHAAGVTKRKKGRTRQHVREEVSYRDVSSEGRVKL